MYKKYYSDDLILDETKGYDETIRRIKIYLENKFNPDFKVDIEKLSYFERQIYDYSEEAAIKHIMENHYNNCNDFKSIFYNTINIEELFYKLKNNIFNNIEKGTLHKNVSENYIFYYPKCGMQIGETKRIVYPDTLKVCTLLGTNQIITMYPYNILNNNDICYFKEKENISKIKVKSGLERFNSRYGNIK